MLLKSKQRKRESLNKDKQDPQASQKGSWFHTAQELVDMFL